MKKFIAIAMTTKSMMPLEPPISPPKPTRRAERPAISTQVRARVAKLVRVMFIWFRFLSTGRIDGQPKVSPALSGRRIRAKPAVLTNAPVRG